MNRLIRFSVILSLAIVAMPISAAENDDKAREQFQDILDGFVSHSFDSVEPYIDKTDLMNRVLSVRPLDNEVREIFDENFSSLAMTAFMQSNHNLESGKGTELIAFEFKDGEGSGVLRIKMPAYQYAYLKIDLRHDRRNRLKIVDWFDSRVGQNYTVSLSEILITLQPRKSTTRALLTIENPSDLQLFQTTEILKASRDAQSPRFFEIYEDFDEQLKRQPLIAKFAVNMAAHAKDADRFVHSLKIFIDLYGQEKDYSAVLADFFLQVQAYEESFKYLKVFYTHFGVEDGSIPARLSALALALGKRDEAEAFAVKATENEPTLELGWWSLLRARSANKDYAGSIAALTYLEDNFGHYLDAAKLQRDRYRSFAALSTSEEFKEWRAAR